MTDTSNGRVTMAILSTKLDQVLEWQKGRSPCPMETLISDDHDRIGALEGRAQRIEDKQGVWTGIQTTISLALAAVAAWLGMRS